MATTKGQRIGIWVIAGTMMIGTIGGFIAMMVQPGNDARDQAALEAEQKDYQQAMDEYQKKVAAQAAELSQKYHSEFAGYTARVGAFAAEDVKELKTEDLKVGDGEEVKDDTHVAMYYIGWNPEGVVFDQSLDGDTLKAPFDVPGPAKTSVIEGWQKGVVGMKIGGIRELTIPAAMAYGEQGSGEHIKPNMPLQFVVMAIAPPEKIAEPEMPPRVKKQYERMYRQYGVQ